MDKSNYADNDNWAFICAANGIDHQYYSVRALSWIWTFLFPTMLYCTSRNLFSDPQPVCSDLFQTDEWRLSCINKEFSVCPSYPPVVIVPKSIDDDALRKVAMFRHGSRFPVLSYYHKKNGMVSCTGVMVAPEGSVWIGSFSEKATCALCLIQFMRHLLFLFSHLLSVCDETISGWWNE